MPHPPLAVVVPARRASSRLPDKLLADVAGRPVLARTLDAIVASGIARHAVYVATGDDALKAVAESCGVGVLVTPSALPSGSHRVAVASRALPSEVQWVVNVQGDEPLLDRHTLPLVLAARTDRSDLVTAACPLTAEEWRSPSTVKAIVDQDGRALWFSRAPVPQRLQSRPAAEVEAFLTQSPHIQRHIGIYAFRRDRIATWHLLPPCIEATTAGLEQLAPLLAGWTLHVATVARPRGPAVDTPADLTAVRKVFGPPS